MRFKALSTLLFLSFAFEAAFAAAGLFAPEWTLGRFQVSVNADTLFLTHALAWTFVFIAAIAAYALLALQRRQPVAGVLIEILGLWWIGVGLAIFIKFGRVDNLFIDSLKGLALVLLNRRPRA